MPATIATIATMPGLPVAGSPAPLPPLPPPAVAGPGSGLIPGGLGPVGPICENKRIHARVRRFSVLGINTLAKHKNAV